MQTQKLYYEDCHISSFRANVIACTETENGWLITLDATAFFPEGGGQASDQGFLENVRVLDVLEKDGHILHLCDAPLRVGASVTGTINWAHRFDLMQQHTGEHILSGIIHRMFGYHNTGFHIGAELVTVDFDGPISDDVLPELEKQANDMIWKNLPITCFYPSREALETLVYRTKRKLPWPVRIVDIPNTDTCACCGIHTAFTGEVGLLKLFSCVKFRDGARIEMACGERAFRLLSQIYDQNRLVSQAFSAKQLETGAAANRMNAMLADEKFRFVGLQKKLFRMIAENYAGKGNTIHVEPFLTSDAVRELCDAIASVCGGTAIVLSARDNAAYSICAIDKAIDILPLGKQVCAELNGRGGGRNGVFQGNIHACLHDIASFFENTYPDFVFNVNSAQ